MFTSKRERERERERESVSEQETERVSEHGGGVETEGNIEYKADSRL